MYQVNKKLRHWSCPNLNYMPDLEKKDEKQPIYWVLGHLVYKSSTPVPRFVHKVSLQNPRGTHIIFLSLNRDA